MIGIKPTLALWMSTGALAARASIAFASGHSAHQRSFADGAYQRPRHPQREHGADDSAFHRAAA